MNISRWPLDKIMELPDWCFGQRWWVGTYVGTVAATVSYFFIEESVPDKFVLWDVLVAVNGHTAGKIAQVTFRLCREVPVSGNIKTLRRLMTNMSRRTETYDIHLPPQSLTHIGPMRNIIEAENDQIGGAIKILSETATVENAVACLISGIPKEVPDWVVSGLAGRR